MRKRGRAEYAISTEPRRRTERSVMPFATRSRVSSERLTLACSRPLSAVADTGVGHATHVSVLQVFLRSPAGTGVRATGRRCSSGRHFRSFCLFSLPWGRRSGLGDPDSNPGGATHSITHRTRPLKGHQGVVVSSDLLRKERPLDGRSSIGPRRRSGSLRTPYGTCW